MGKFDPKKKKKVKPAGKGRPSAGMKKRMKANSKKKKY